jgi:hypothetical protein
VARNPPHAISLFADGFAIQYRQSIIDFGLSIPVVSGWAVFARSGATARMLGLTVPTSLLATADEVIE